MLDRGHAEFIRENFASIVFCGGTMCGYIGRYGVGSGV